MKEPYILQIIFEKLQGSGVADFIMKEIQYILRAPS